jgi:hypothetical protein
MQQQPVLHRRRGDEKNVEEDSQTGTSAGGVSNWGCQFGRCIVFHPFTVVPINKGSNLFYIPQALHPSSGGTNKPVLLTVLGLARDRTILISKVWYS